jgi:putative transposase
MTISRKQQISLDETSYYHCISRCVRRAFLCGEDKLTGDSYEHRRSWIVEKLKQLDGVFSISIRAYAVTQNHSHTVLKVDRETVLAGPLDIHRLTLCRHYLRAVGCLMRGSS